MPHNCSVNCLGKSGSGLAAIVAICMLLLAACHKSDPKPPVDQEGDLTGIPYNPVAYDLVKPAHFPQVPIPDSNKLTVDGVQLGRRLFYDPILSGDSSMSCAGCHLPEASFTDHKAVSTGIDGIAGRRSAMSILNAAYITNGLFWDGRTKTLEQQALMPVTDPIEMHAQWSNVIEKLQNHKTYPEYFRKAFGISNTREINKYLAAKAIAQFERILISSGKSKYDQARFEGKSDLLDDEELDGMLMFFDEGGSGGLGLPDAQCFHCHGGITMTGNNYFNNGLDSVLSLDDFKDKGRWEVTKQEIDKGRFRAPTLRNIALTAPYMHDGRFKTLEEVVEHYHGNGMGVSNEDPFIRQIGFPVLGTNPVRYSGLTPYQKKAIVKFLHTLTDTDFVNNPDIQNPFK